MCDLARSAAASTAAAPAATARARSCRCGELACACTGTTPAEVAQLRARGVRPQLLRDSSFCHFGELCGVPPDAGERRRAVPRNVCYSDFDLDRRPYCARCTNGGGHRHLRHRRQLLHHRHPHRRHLLRRRLQRGPGVPPRLRLPRHSHRLHPLAVQRDRRPARPTRRCPARPTPTASAAALRQVPPARRPASAPGMCRLREGSSFGYCSCQVDLDCAAAVAAAPASAPSAGSKCVTDQDCRSIQLRRLRRRRRLPDRAELHAHQRADLRRGAVRRAVGLRRRHAHAALDCRPGAGAVKPAALEGTPP